jgi:hypothetical protein
MSIRKSFSARRLTSSRNATKQFNIWQNTNLFIRNSSESRRTRTISPETVLIPAEHEPFRPKQFRISQNTNCFVRNGSESPRTRTVSSETVQNLAERELFRPKWFRFPRNVNLFTRKGSCAGRDWTCFSVWRRVLDGFPSRPIAGDLNRFKSLSSPTSLRCRGACFLSSERSRRKSEQS